MLHVSIKAETLFNIGGFPVTNSVLGSVLVLVLFTLVSLHFYLNRNTNSTFVFFIRFVLTKLNEVFEPILGKLSGQVAPVVLSIFMFILFSNWIGLLPGFGSIMVEPATSHDSKVVTETDSHEAVTPSEDTHEEEVHHSTRVPLFRGTTADLNATTALGLFAFLFIQFHGFKALGFGYLKKFFDFKGVINAFIGILELVSEFSKILSFSFRLFGNIFAGEVLLAVIAFLVPVLAFPFFFMEVFVGLVQALVFAMLTSVFVKGATSHH